MAATGTDEEHIALRLVLNQEKSQVLFAEAEKDFVDVLFSFLTFPLGTIARLVREESEREPVRFGCVSSLHESLAYLDEQCFSTEACKQMLLQPRNSAEAYCRNVKLNIDDTEPTECFSCYYCSLRDSLNLSTFKNTPCRKCGMPMHCQVTLKESCIRGKGFVNGNATFIVTDSLHVIPNSLGAGLSLLKNCGIDGTRSVHYLTVNVTKKKVLDLLKCSLLSGQTLTDMFVDGTSLPTFQQTLHCLSQHAANDASGKYNVKLIRRKSNGNIVIAQGEEDFANFILSFLALPLGGVVRMLEGVTAAGSVDRLYKSIVDLDENYFISKEAKNMLVDSQVAPQFHLRSQLLPICESHAPKYYHHGDCRNNLHISSSMCPEGNVFQNCKSLEMIDPKSHTENHSGFVKGPTMYMVADDLSVTRISAVSGISLFGSLDITLSDLEEKAVRIGVKEVLSILKASLTSSSSALTNGLSHLFTAVKEEK